MPLVAPMLAAAVASGRAPHPRRATARAPLASIALFAAPLLGPLHDRYLATASAVLPPEASRIADWHSSSLPFAVLVPDVAGDAVVVVCVFGTGFFSGSALDDALLAGAPDGTGSESTTAAEPLAGSAISPPSPSTVFFLRSTTPATIPSTAKSTTAAIIGAGLFFGGVGGVGAGNTCPLPVVGCCP